MGTIWGIWYILLNISKTISVTAMLLRGQVLAMAKICYEKNCMAKCS